MPTRPRQQHELARNVAAQTRKVRHLQADRLKTGARGSEITSTRLTELLTRDYPGLLSLLHRKLNSRELAADILNDAVVTTLEHARAGRLTDPERIAGYVFKVSMNLARNHHRNMDNRTDLRLPPDTLAAMEPHGLDGLGTEQLMGEVRTLVAELSSPRDREIVKRFYLDEEDKKTICADLQLSSLQFNQVIARARQRMKQQMEARGLVPKDLFSEP